MFHDLDILHNAEGNLVDCFRHSFFSVFSPVRQVIVSGLPRLVIIPGSRYVVRQ